MSNEFVDRIADLTRQLIRVKGELAEQRAVCAKVGELAEKLRIYRSKYGFMLSMTYERIVEDLLAAIPIAGESRQKATVVCKHCEGSGWCGVPEERCPYCGGKKQATGAGDQQGEKHACPEWDYAVISPGDPEFEACICFDRKPQSQDSKPIGLEGQSLKLSGDPGPKWTPGPWKAIERKRQRFDVCTPDYMTVAHVWGGDHRESNAALIAAAPDLYQAVEDCRLVLANGVLSGIIDREECARFFQEKVDPVLAKVRPDIRWPNYENPEAPAPAVRERNAEGGGAGDQREESK